MRSQLEKGWQEKTFLFTHRVANPSSPDLRRWRRMLLAIGDQRSEPLDQDTSAQVSRIKRAISLIGNSMVLVWEDFAPTRFQTIEPAAHDIWCGPNTTPDRVTDQNDRAICSLTCVDSGYWREVADTPDSLECPESAQSSHWTAMFRNSGFGQQRKFTGRPCASAISSQRTLTRYRNRVYLVQRNRRLPDDCSLVNVLVVCM